MPEILSGVEVRVLACLIEKQMSTPEYYPMTLNALVNACNQKSNRSPVVSYDEPDVQSGIEGLRSKGLAAQVQRADSRALKYGHSFTERFDLGSKEIAVLCELMLRGPQTPGELRNRCERLCPFQDLQDLDTVLVSLMEQADPLVVRLPRQPGQKEQRFKHLFGAASDNEQAAGEAQPQPSFSEMESLSDEVKAIREELKMLKEEFEKFKAQFS